VSIDSLRFAAGWLINYHRGADCEQKSPNNAACWHVDGSREPFTAACLQLDGKVTVTVTLEKPATDTDTDTDARTATKTQTS